MRLSIDRNLMAMIPYDLTRVLVAAAAGVARSASREADTFAEAKVTAYEDRSVGTGALGEHPPWGRVA